MAIRGGKWLRATVWFVALAVVAGADDWLWLGWQRHKHLNAAGTLSGPYETWQVLGLVAVLVVVVASAARRGQWIATASIPIVLTVLFSIQAATDPDGDGLWPIGAGLVLFGSSLGTALVVVVAQSRRRELDHRTAHRLQQ